MKAILQVLLATTLLTTGTFSNACIWQARYVDNSSPFWPSNEIEVCFLRPAPPQVVTDNKETDQITRVDDPDNPLNDEYRTMYDRNMAIIRQTVERQINSRSNFNLKGFNLCPLNDDLTAPKIRIDLNAEGVIGGVADIGPIGSRNSPNVTVNTFNVLGSSRSFRPALEVSRTGLHEIMHSLGMHHVGYWDQHIPADLALYSDVIQVGDGRDMDSIMGGVAHFDSQNFAVMSDRDVACLNSVVSRRILSRPMRGLSEERSRLQPVKPSSSPINGNTLETLQ